MLETLFHIPQHLGSLPVFGCGLLLALWLAFSVCLLGYLAWRQGFNADTWGYVPLLAIVAAVIAWLLPGLCEPEGLPIRGYGVMILTAVVAATSLALWRAKRRRLDPEMLFSLAFWLCLPGILGARVFYVVQNWSTQFWVVYLDTKSLVALLTAVINVAQGGLVVYGSLFGGLLGMVLFCRKHRVPLLATADLIAPSLALGLALGRIGCLMNGCCYGGLCELPWALSFPAGSPPYYSQIARGVFYGLVLTEEPTARATLLSVDAHSAAGRAGLRAGNLLTAINDDPVRTAGDAHAIFERLFKRHSPVILTLADGREIHLPAAEPPAQSAGTPHATICLDRRLPDMPAAVGLRSFLPPRRPVVRPHADHLPDPTLSGRGPAHRRNQCVGHRSAHLAKHQLGDADRRADSMGVHPAAAPRQGVWYAIRGRS